MSGSLSMALVAALVPAARADDDDDTERTVETAEAADTANTANTTNTTTDDDRRRRRRVRPFPLIHGDRCSPHLFFKVHTLSPRNFFLPRSNFVDGPGGTVTASVTREHEVRAFLETENERRKASSTTQPLTLVEPITTREVVHEMRRMGLPHLEERHMVFTGHEYSREITKGMYGHLWYRVFGYRIGWSAWQVMGTCRDVRVARGYANIPARVEGWRYWETKYPTFKHRRLPWKP